MQRYWTARILQCERFFRELEWERSFWIWNEERLCELGIRKLFVKLEWKRSL